MGFPARRTALLSPATTGPDVTLTLTGIATVCFLGAMHGAIATGLTGSGATTSINSFLATAKLLTGVSATLSSTPLVATPTFALQAAPLTTALGFVTVTGANAQTVVDTFRVQVLNGMHAFGPSVVRVGTGADTFKLALYFTTATRGPADTIYTSTGEVTGTNYSAGGIVLANTVPPTNSSGIAYWTPSSTAVFSNITITTPFDCMVLYNNTSASKLAVAVFVFGAQVITAGDFTLQFAANNSTTGLIRLT